MAIQTVFVGTTPGDDTGDPARTAFIKINDNFTQAENAASRLVGTAAGNVMQVGAFGLGARNLPVYVGGTLNTLTETSFRHVNTNEAIADGFPSSTGGELFVIGGVGNGNYAKQFYFPVVNNNNQLYTRTRNNGAWTAWVQILHTGNTTVDPNGFIKAASPIVSLYRDRAESNGSAELEGMQFERIAAGHYRLTGVPELSRDGWYIETPKDRNGTVYFTLDYVESEGQLDIRTYTPDYSSGRATNGAPVDIIDGRFVSLRFAASPETELPEEA